MLEGKNVNVRLMEKEDVDFTLECINNLDFYGEYDPITQISKTEMMKKIETETPSAAETEKDRSNRISDHEPRSSPV